MGSDTGNGNGKGEGTQALEETMGSPLFERELLTPGLNIQEAITKTYFSNELSNVNAAKYIGHLLRWNKRGKMTQALLAVMLRLNGNRAVEFRATKFGTQAHGRLYFDPDASAKDKKIFEKMQMKERRDEGRNREDE